MFEVQVAAIESQWDDASADLMQRAGVLAVDANPVIQFTASRALLCQQLVAGVNARFVDLCVTVIGCVEAEVSAKTGMPLTTCFDENLFTILLRGHDPASGGAQNPHVPKYIPVPALRPPPADGLSLQIVNRF